jgi:inosine/xanthosine triphosphatase
MKIAVGSHNPVKINAARHVLSEVYPGAEIIPAAVESGVSSNPRGDEEAIAGAKNRARKARESAGADLGVGLEGGTTTIAGKHMTGGWCAVFDGKRYSLGGGGHILLPPAVDRGITREGKELGETMDELSGGRNTKQKMGAIGILTRGLSSRQQAYEYILTYALAPLLSPGYYSSTKIFPGKIL